MILTVVLWIIATLGLATLSMFLGKVFGKAILIAIYTALVVMAQVFANKLVMFGGFVVPAAVIVYGVSFLITDVLCEFHSKKDARTAVIGGFIGSVLLVFGIRVMLAWDYPVFWKGQQAMETALGLTGRIVLGSLVSFMVSQNFDVYLYDKIKQLTKGKHLWLRNNVSTMSSQLIDTILFISVAFYGTMSNEALVGMMIGQYVVKLIIALCDTPFLYLTRLYYKR